MDRDRDEFRPRRRRPRRYEEDDREYVPRRRGANPWAIAIGVVSVVVIFFSCLGYGVFSRTMRQMKQEEEAKAAKITAERQKESDEGEGTRETRACMQRIGEAVQAHVAAKGVYPHNSYEVREGRTRPLLSCRVHLLPYLGKDGLYRRFKLDEPWDSAANRPLLNEMPDAFGTRQSEFFAGKGKTHFRGFSHAGAMFESPKAGERPRLLLPADVRDGEANTILFANAKKAVEWTKPEDIDWSPGRPRPDLDGEFTRKPFELVFFCNGRVRAVKKDISEQTLRRLIDAQDGMPIEEDWDYWK